MPQRSSAVRRTSARTTVATGSRFPARRKSQPQSSGIGKLLSGLAAGRTAGKARRKAGKAATGGGGGRLGGLALLAGAAGLAFRNRDKLKRAVGRGGANEMATPSPTSVPGPTGAGIDAHRGSGEPPTTPLPPSPGVPPAPGGPAL